MSDYLWEKIAYEDLGKHADELFHFEQPTLRLFSATTPQNKRTVRLLSLDVAMVGRSPRERRLGLLATPEDFRELCRQILGDD